MSASLAMINDLKSRVGTARAKLAEAEKALSDAIASTCRAQPGDIVRSKGGGVALVRRINTWLGSPYPVAVLRKQDGTFGMREVSMYRSEWRDYEVIGREDAA